MVFELLTAKGNIFVKLDYYFSFYASPIRIIVHQ